MKGASNIAPMGVRIPEDLKEKIQARARANGRSMNSEIVKILSDAVDGAAKVDAPSLNEIRSFINKIFDEATNKKDNQ